MKIFFVGLKDKLLIIKETADGYEFNEHLHETQPTRLAFDPENEHRIYCATNGDGLWRSEDGGDHWSKIGESHISTETHIDDGIPSSKMTSVAVNPIKRVDGNSIVYAGTEPSMLFYSEDNGRSWHEFEGIQNLPSKENWAFPPRPYTHFVRWITPSYSNEDHLAISIEAGAVLNTHDHGMTWKDRPEKSPIDVHTLLAHPKAPGRLYAANGDGSSNKERAYAESQDEGLTWEYMSEGVEDHPYLYNIEVFVTGGIGGVHRGYEEHMDVSADLDELAQTPVTVVCAGAKAILDLPRTLEYLETKGVPVLGYGTDYLPAFFSSTSEYKLNARVESPEEVANIMKYSNELAFDGGILVANPIPTEDEIPAEEINEIIEEALVEERKAGIKGKDSTPFLLAKIVELTEGKSLEANIALVYNNAKVGAEIAVAYANEAK